jgi:hypothetical protein
MSGAIHPLPQYAFMAWCLVKKCRDTFYLTFIVICLGVSIVSFQYSLSKRLFKISSDQASFTEKDRQTYVWTHDPLMPFLSSRQIKSKI